MRTKDLKWLAGLPAEDLPEPYAEMARVVGVSTVVDLAKAMGGSMLYLPKLESLLRMVRDKRIRDEYTGYNCRQLAKKYGITERRVRSIVAGVVPRLPSPKSKKRKKVDSGQIPLFDVETF